MILFSHSFGQDQVWCCWYSFNSTKFCFGYFICSIGFIGFIGSRGSRGFMGSIDSVGSIGSTGSTSYIGSSCSIR